MGLRHQDPSGFSWKKVRTSSSMVHQLHHLYRAQMRRPEPICGNIGSVHSLMKEQGEVVEVLELYDGDFSAQEVSDEFTLLINPDPFP